MDHPHWPMTPDQSARRDTRAMNPGIAWTSLGTNAVDVVVVAADGVAADVVADAARLVRIAVANATSAAASSKGLEMEPRGIHWIFGLRLRVDAKSTDADAAGKVSAYIVVAVVADAVVDVVEARRDAFGGPRRWIEPSMSCFEDMAM